MRHSDRDILCTVKKASSDDDSFWPRLTKHKVKVSTERAGRHSSAYVFAYTGAFNSAGVQQCRKKVFNSAENHQFSALLNTFSFSELLCCPAYTYQYTVEVCVLCSLFTNVRQGHCLPTKLMYTLFSLCSFYFAISDRNYYIGKGC